jgi:hypothetical protein
MGGNGTAGATYVSGVYQQVQSTLNSIGSNAKLFTNEYNVLNNNSDLYGQWYSQHVESIRNNGGGVSGIGTEYYNNPGVGQSGSQVDPGRAYGTWQNLSAQGLPLEVTEFGETAGATSDEANGLTTAMTLAFGTQNMTGFTLWGYFNYGAGMYSGSVGSVLYDNSFNITPAGMAYEALMKTFTTDMNSMVGSDGSIALPDGAFYGQYELIANGQDYLFNYGPSTGSVTIDVPEPTALMGAVLGLALLFKRKRRGRAA